MPQVYIEPHARWISTPPSTASTPTATEDSSTCAARRAWRVHGGGWKVRRPAEGAEGVHNGWSRGCRGVRIGFRAPRAHLGLGGDEHVLRARHERRLELGPELGLDVAAHRAAWGLCGLEAIGVRDEREQEHGGTEHCHQTSLVAPHQHGAVAKPFTKKTARPRRKGWQKNL